MADISKRLEKAEKHLQKGKMEDALKEFRAALKEDPDNNQVRERAADLCISLNQAKDAAELLSELLDRQSGPNDQAKSVLTYKKLARIATPSMEQSYHYAECMEKNNKKEAAEAYQRAAEGFAKARKKKEALQAMKRLVALEASLENFKREGELAAELGEGEVAAAAFFQAGELEQKASGGGHAWFERAYAQDKSNPNAALSWARTLLERGDAVQALRIIEPLGKKKDASAPLREVYARALMGLKRPAEALPIVWPLYEKDPKQIETVVALTASFLDTSDYGKALSVARKAAEAEEKASRKKDYVGSLKEMADKHAPNAEFLEFLVGLYNETNREHDYADALTRLFDLYYAAGNFLKAADSLDAAAEVDPYERGHQNRLETLKGKIDANRYRSIANRFTAAVKITGAGAEEDSPKSAKQDNEPTVLEDFMLQAEIFLQYSMRSKAVERLQRIQKLFPGEEQKNEKLRSLYLSAGLAVAPAAAPASASSGASAPPRTTGTYSVGKAQANENAVDNIARVTEITRNIYRQANVKSVLFAAVNDVGRHWNASRCIAGLCTPGKPPSAALEYCAPGVAQSDVMAIVKLIATLQGLAVQQGQVAITNAKKAPELEPVKQFIESLGIESILAVPLVDGEEHVGILFLEQCGAQRPWRTTDVLVLKTIADQVVLAVNNCKLRNLMKTLAVTDEKSGLLKRSSYLDVLLSEIRRALGQASQSSVMLLHFGRASALVKEVGEAAVESMMQQIGQLCCSHIRQNDVAVRYEHTTIALVLADTNEKNAFFVVDKLRKVFAGLKVPGTDRAVTCSMGIAEAVMQARFDPVDIVTEVINRAESALEIARAEGGNKAHALAPSIEAAAVA